MGIKIDYVQIVLVLKFNGTAREKLNEVKVQLQIAKYCNTYIQYLYIKVHTTGFFV